MNIKVTVEDLKEYVINGLELGEKDGLEKKDMGKAIAEAMREFNNRN